MLVAQDQGGQRGLLLRRDTTGTVPAARSARRRHSGAIAPITPVAGSSGVVAPVNEGAIAPVGWGCGGTTVAAPDEDEFDVPVLEDDFPVPVFDVLTGVGPF